MKWNNIKEKISSADNIITNIITAALIFVLIFMVYSKKRGDEIFVFGYRPVFALTGSMEPEIMTHSIMLTKKVDKPSDIKENDIVSFYVTQNGRRVNVTHRIRKIEAGYIITKGDNNESEDLYPVPIEDVHSKVVTVWNGFSQIYNFFAYVFNHKLYCFVCGVKFLGYTLAGTLFFAAGIFGVLKAVEAVRK